MRGRKITIIKNTDKSRSNRWQVRYRDGNSRRRSKFFPTRAAAEVYAEAKSTELKNFGLRALYLEDSVKEDALRGIELLAPFNRSLLEAVRFYAAHLERNQRTCSLDVLFREFSHEKERQQLSQSHLSDLKARVGRFIAAFPNRSVNSVQADEIGEWIQALPLGPQSKLHFRRSLHSFFGFAVRQKYADHNPVADTPKIKVPEKEVQIYKPEEVSRLLASADAAALPYLALGAFAGIRRAELLRLKWEDIRFDTGNIFIGAQIAKTRSRRVIPIMENLREWLCSYVNYTGLIIPHPAALQKRLGDARKRAGVCWRANGLRHSFASYRLAVTNDIGQTACEMGNSPDVIHKHYRQLVTDQQAKEYWAINPSLEVSAVA